MSDTINFAASINTETINITSSSQEGSVNILINQTLDRVNFSANSVIPFLDWSSFVLMWDSEPIFVGTIIAGDVWSYVLNGITRYRLVPNPYNPSEDAFYANFSDDLLSGLIAARDY